jgi:hypothetical protein
MKMEHLPKIAQQRLQATAGPGVHPDPDLLTAFAEKSLNERERDQVLQHLGECTDCRNILALVMPETELAPPASPQRSSWLAWPVLRWGALAACVVVVSTAITLHYEGQQGDVERMVATKAPASAPPDSPPAENQGSRRQSEKLAANTDSTSIDSTNPDSRSQLQSDRDFAVASKLAKQRGDETRDAAKASATNGFKEPASKGLKGQEELKNNSTENDSLARAGAGESGAVLSTNKPSQSVGQATSAVMAPAAPPPPKTANKEPQPNLRNNSADLAATGAAETVTAQSESVPMRKTAQNAEQKAKDESRRNESGANAEAVAGISAADQKADKAAAESGLDAHGGSLRAKTLPARTLSDAKAKLASRWTVSIDGEIQHSTDAGKTWQTIPVANHVTFHALAANDADIWVGGSAGALYHSADDGRHWTQIMPFVDGKPLTVEIIGLEFTDSRHGRLTADTHEIWVTSDGGATWTAK